MKKNKDIAIGISTFLRDDSLLKLIESLAIYCSEFKLYIVDQGGYNNYKKIVYQGLKKLGHSINFIPYDSGISMARKTLKSMCQEPYLVFMQDDFLATPNTNLYKLQEILEFDSKLGVVAGKITNQISMGFYFDYADNKLCYFSTEYLLNKKLISWKKTNQNIEYLYTEIIPDFSMWKKEVPNIFDINVKTIEHSHSYLLLKYKTNFKVAYCPSCEIEHHHNQKNEGYNKLRSRKQDIEYLKQYWGIVDFYKFDKQFLNKLDKPLEIKKIEELDKFKIPEPIIDKLEPKKEEIIPKKSELTEVNKKIITYEALEVFDILNKNNIDYILIKETCLNSLCQKEIDTIKIAVPNQHQYNLIHQLFPNNNFYIEIKHFNKIKTHRYKNIIVKVPFPVIKYLEKEFSKSWEELQRWNIK